MNYIDELKKHRDLLAEGPVDPNWATDLEKRAAQIKEPAAHPAPPKPAPPAHFELDISWRIFSDLEDIEIQDPKGLYQEAWWEPGSWSKDPDAVGKVRQMGYEPNEEELEDANRFIKVDARKIKVTNRNQIEIAFQYPLEHPITMNFGYPGGFSLEEFCEAVRKGYQHIYDRPDEYGVWGHGPDDLFLENISEEEPSLFVIGVGS